jgi:hypothetical protein
VTILHERVLNLSMVLLALVPPAPAFAAKEPGLANDFKYLSSGTELLIILRMDQLSTGDALNKLCKAFPTLEKGFRRDYGLGSDGIKCIVEGSGLWTTAPTVRVIHLNKAVAPELIAKAKDEPTTYKKEKLNTLTVYVPETGDGEGFCFVNDKTLVVSEPKVLKVVLARDKAPTLPPGLQAALKASEPTSTLTVAIDFAGFTGGCKFPLIRHEILKRTGFDVYQIKARLVGASVTAKAGREVSLRALVVCEQGKPADDYQRFGEAIRAYASKEMKKASQPKDLLEAVNRIQFSTKGSLTEARVTVKDEVVIPALRAVFQAPQ